MHSCFSSLVESMSASPLGHVKGTELGTLCLILPTGCDGPLNHTAVVAVVSGGNSGAALDWLLMSMSTSRAVLLRCKIIFY